MKFLESCPTLVPVWCHLLLTFCVWICSLTTFIRTFKHAISRTSNATPYFIHGDYKPKSWKVVFHRANLRHQIRNIKVSPFIESSSLEGYKRLRSAFEVLHSGVIEFLWLWVFVSVRIKQAFTSWWTRYINIPSVRGQLVYWYPSQQSLPTDIHKSCFNGDSTLKFGFDVNKQVLFNNVEFHVSISIFFFLRGGGGVSLICLIFVQLRWNISFYR